MSAWWIASGIAAICIASLALAVALRLGTRWVGLGGGNTSRSTMLIEAIMFGLILLVVAWPVAARRMLVGLSGRRLVFLVTVIVAIFGVQLASITSIRLMPFTTWAMYTSRAPTLDFVEYIAEFESGQIEHFRFEFVRPGSSRTLMARFSTLIRIADDPTQDETKRADALAELERNMRILVEIHDRVRPEERIVALEVAVRTVIAAEYDGPESVRRSLVTRVEFGDR